MSKEYTHVVQAKGKAGDWKNMTKHIGEGDAKAALADAKKATKNKGEFRVTAYTATKPAAKAAPKVAAKPAAKATPKAAAGVKATPRKAK